MRDERFEAVKKVARDGMQRLGVPGVAFGVLDGDTEHVAGFGVTNVDHPLEVTAETLFQIGSTTKTMTATAMMRLVEQGKVELDAPVRSYVPGFRMADEEVTAKVTPRHLLTHLGGWLGDYFDDTGRGEDALAIYVGRMAELPQLTPLGTVWSYNNAGFSLAGRVIECVTGQSYEEALTELVLQPLGLSKSFILPEEAMVHRFAAGHAKLPDGRIRVLRPWQLARSAHPAGGVISCVLDQLAYARFQLGDGLAEDGSRVLEAGTMVEMQTWQAAAGAMADGVGLSWLLRDMGGARIVQHGGATLGQQSAFLMVPARRFAFTMLTNSAGGAELHRIAADAALSAFLGIEREEPAFVAVEEEGAQEYLGRYEALLTHAEITWEGQRLVLQSIPQGGFPKRDSPPAPAPPPAEMRLTGRDAAVVVEGPSEHGRMEFLRDGAGRIEWVRIGGRIHRKIS